MAELGTGWISIVADTKSINPDIKKALGGVDPAAAQAGQSMGSKLAGGIGKALKVGAAGVGVAAGAALATSLTKGMGRLVGIENAEAKLSGLGHSASAVTGIMDNALVSVKGTAFGLEEAATVAASAVAAGVKPGKDLERTLKLTGDAATIAGTSIGDMGQVFGKVEASNKIMGGEIMQLNKMGIPIVQLLGKELGKTAEEVTAMASKGQIDFATFQNAMESGLGGAALKSGETFQGALANMGAAAGRLGATLAGPFFGQAKGAFGGITESVDGLNDRLKPVMETFGTWLTGTAVPKLREFGDSAKAAFDELRNSDSVQGAITGLVGTFKNLGGLAKDLWPSIKNIGTALADASAAIGISSWQVMLSTLDAVADVAKVVLVPALDALSGLMKSQPALVRTALAAWLAFKTVPAIFGRVTAAVLPLNAAAGTAAGGVRNLSSAFRDSWRYAGQANPEISNLGRVAVIAGGNARAAFDGLKGSLNGVYNALGGGLGLGLGAVAIGVTAISSSVSATKRSQESLSAAIKKTEEAQVALDKAFRSDGGKYATASIEAMGGAVEAASSKIDSLSSGRSGMAKFGTVLQEVVPIVSFFSRGSVEAANAADDMHRHMGLASESMDKLGLSTEDVTAVVGGSTREWESFRSRLLATGEGGRYALEELSPLRDEAERLKSVAKTLTPGIAELQGSLYDLADAAGDAESKAKALKSAMRALHGDAITLGEAEEKNADNMRELASLWGEGIDQAQGFGSAMLLTSGYLDTTTENGAKLNGAILELTESIADVGAKGGDWRLRLDEGTEALRAQAAQAGFTKPEIDALLETYKLTPETVETLMAVNGADAAVADLATVKLGMDQLKPGEPLTVEVLSLTDEAKTDLEKLDGVKVEVTKDGSFKITAQDEEARARIDEVVRQKFLLTEKPATVSVGMDLFNFVIGQERVGTGIAELDQKRATPQAWLNSQPFQDENANIHRMLGELDGSNGEPTVSADLREFAKGVGFTDGELARLDRAKGKPEIIAIVDEAMRRIRDFEKEANNASRNRTATITMQTIRTEGPFSRLADRAAGGRLPTTGPGTSTVDGILGVDSSGVPIANVDAGEWVVNRRSSDKHDALLGAINRDDPRLDSLPAFADGGRLRDLADGMGASRPLDGAPYVWGGTNWGDCSGAMSALAREASGLDPFGGRFATGNQGQYLADLGYSSGRGGAGDLRFGWFNGGSAGGHTAGTLPDGTNVEMGGGYGGGKVGGSVGADHPQFTNHAYLPVGPGIAPWTDLGSDPSDPTSGSYYGGDPTKKPVYDSDGKLVEAGGTHYASESRDVTRMKTASELAKDGAGILVDGFFETLGLSGTALTDSAKLHGDDGSSVRVTESVPVEPSATERASGAQVHEPRPATEAEIAQDTAVLFDPAGGAEQWRATVEQGLTRASLALSNADRTVEQIAIESGGSPDFVNTWDSNAKKGDPSVGLLQVIGSTFRAFRDHDLPDDQKHPLANITAALNYVKDKYGDPESIWPTAAGYKDGGTVTGGRGGIDDVPAWLTSDEFVVERGAARRNRPLLEAVNAGADIAGGDTTYAPVFNGIGMEEVVQVVMQTLRGHERHRVRATTSRRR